jgi:hypothetical protein
VCAELSDEAEPAAAAADLKLLKGEPGFLELAGAAPSAPAAVIGTAGGSDPASVPSVGPLGAGAAPAAVDGTRHTGSPEAGSAAKVTLPLRGKVMMPAAAASSIEAVVRRLVLP